MIRNTVTDAILSRQTIRAYKREQISEEMLETLMQAAKAAPSGRNMQPCYVRFVQDADMLHEMHIDFKNLVGWDTPAYTRSDTNPFYHNAPMFVFIYAANDSAMDAGIMTENICIAAEGMGLGTCIVGSAGALFNDESGKKWNEKLHVPRDFRYQIGVCVGYPDETPPRKPRFDDRIEVIR
ncbi:MAG: nitroreductase family protein [Clostridia bacterium]|nr:nitroreductase family protein [Clostridia bacterium]